MAKDIGSVFIMAIWTALNSWIKLKPKVAREIENGGRQTSEKTYHLCNALLKNKQTKYIIRIQWWSRISTNNFVNGNQHIKEKFPYARNSFGTPRMLPTLTWYLLLKLSLSSFVSFVDGKHRAESNHEFVFYEYEVTLPEIRATNSTRQWPGDRLAHLSCRQNELYRYSFIYQLHFDMLFAWLFCLSFFSMNK